MSEPTFSYHGVDLDYENGTYNDARLNERAVEIPIAREFVDGYRGKNSHDGGPIRGLEVGDVLRHYGVNFPGHIVDAYVDAEGVNRMDLFDVRASYDFIVSVSTIEHVRWDLDPDNGRNPYGAVDAIGHLRSLLRPGGTLLATWGVGYHDLLDQFVREGVTGATREALYARGGPDSEDPVEWFPQDPRAWFLPYGHSSRWAEGVYIAEWTRE